MEKKEKYIAKAMLVFRLEGLRMSLEELAEKMGIAKKTLYNHFVSKDEVLLACVHSLFADLNRRMEVLYDRDMNAIECMLKAFSELKCFFQQLSPLFLNDMKKLYPEMTSVSHTEGLGKFSDQITMNIQKGIEEGVYRGDLNSGLLAQYLTYSVFGYYIHSMLVNSELVDGNYFETMVKYNLRALVSDQGRAVLQSIN